MNVSTSLQIHALFPALRCQFFTDPWAYIPQGPCQLAHGTFPPKPHQSHPPQAHLQRSIEGDTRLGLGTDSHFSKIYNGVRFHSQAFDHHRVLPLVTVLPGKATEPKWLGTIMAARKEEKSKVDKKEISQRCQEPDQPPRPEPQELGPLNGDTATTVQLCASEEAEQHQKDLTRILQQHEEDKKKWTQQVQKERDLELQEKLDEQRRVLEGEHEAALQVLRASYEQEKEALTHSFQEAKTALQETIDGLTSQLETFQAKMKRVEESILSQDYKKHIKDYGSPSQFWEQELESLHFVIEMKNERIHELDKRLILMETVKEKNLMLEEKITTLQQENEDLHVRGRNQMVVSRQLSEDLLLTREALEKESQLRRQLQQEKEELLYRVLGADASPTFPLASVTPTEVSFLAT
ncbi:Coiled-coil domain-containing protein 69 [Pteropus alecto]|uniref:Coiled-coil domain-containing protein 69 n=1 Tax=Pteropus alecto TaxID=9402 RepID=L5L0L4_PTEAL|nr:Coiled-coil domain-containing protein 69 [Pteropus alecto]